MLMEEDSSLLKAGSGKKESSSKGIQMEVNDDVMIVRRTPEDAETDPEDE